jgi:hypothetical protein
MSSLEQTSYIKIRLQPSIKKAVEDIVRLRPLDYDNVSNFVRSAIIEKIRNERGIKQNGTERLY